jgi:hypothetical protein
MIPIRSDVCPLSISFLILPFCSNKLGFSRHFIPSISLSLRTELQTPNLVYLNLICGHSTRDPANRLQAHMREREEEERKTG